jgi:peroxiredoxin
VAIVIEPSQYFAKGNKMQSNHLLIGILSICALGAAAGCGPATTAGPGEKSPAEASGAGNDQVELSDFTLKDVDGRAHSLSDYLGKNVIVISFWATWCEPCKKEMVQLQQLYNAHADKGVMMISISMDEPETQGDVRPYVKQRGYTYPILIDAESQVTARLNPRNAAPFTLIIDKSGKIVWTHESYVPGDEVKLEKAVLQALGMANE